MYENWKWYWKALWWIVTIATLIYGVILIDELVGELAWILVGLQ